MESRDDRHTPQREVYRERHGDEARDGGDHWRAQHAREERTSSYEGPYSAGPVSAQSEEPMGDVMRRATSHGDEDQSPDCDDRSMYHGQYTPEHRRDGVMHSDPKKRKRNFSNRTKTGCLTCRKRKKKCDEQKPECEFSPRHNILVFIPRACLHAWPRFVAASSGLFWWLTIHAGNNCIKGGFVCAGYPPQRGAWASKPESKPAQVNIESKDPNYVPPGAYGMPQQPPPYSSSSQQPMLGQQPKRDSLPYNRGQPTLRITPPQGRPLQTDDDRLTASTMPSSIISPDNKLSALSGYTTSASANVFPTPVSAAVSAFSDRTPKEYQRVPPLHDLTRTDPDQQQPPPPPPPPPQSTINTHPPFSSMLHSGRKSTPPAPQSAMSPHPPSGGGAQATAQLALSHAQFPSDRPRRQKEEMLNGRPYYPFDKELVLERERCNAACWRFNNSTNPNLGVSPAERARLFRDILHPREGIQLSPSLVSPVTHAGRVGENATVEAPFNCDYGYNVHIGNNVAIGRNCLINDVCEVKIGNNVIISPNVCIYTGTCSTNPRYRNGNQGTQYGKGVVIEDDVWIAANVVILPGVRIGKGSTVGAGSVVTRVCFFRLSLSLSLFRCYQPGW
jgi:acetyltransferase-like isoleucine patch superfamily enzyme